MMREYTFVAAVADTLLKEGAWAVVVEATCFAFVAFTLQIILA